jgi:hypothetical protein
LMGALASTLHLRQSIHFFMTIAYLQKININAHLDAFANQQST